VEHVALRLYIKVFAASLAALLGVIWGGWWAPFVVGLAFGAEERRARNAVPAGAGIGLISWLVPLAVGHFRYGLGPTAESLAAIMGFGHASAAPIVLTLVVGSLLGLTGAWLGGAVAAVVAPRAGVDAARNE
jgi:hypothetical protein